MQVLADFLLVGGISITTAVLALWAIQRVPARADGSPMATEPAEAVALLFENGILSHATQSAAHTLEMEAGTHDWEDLRETLLARFPTFPRMAYSGSRGTQTLDAADGLDADAAGDQLLSHQP